MPPRVPPNAAPREPENPDPSRFLDMRPLSTGADPASFLAGLLKGTSRSDRALESAEWLEYLASQLPAEDRSESADPVILFALGRLCLDQQARAAAIRYLQRVDAVTLEAVRSRVGRDRA